MGTKGSYVRTAVKFKWRNKVDTPQTKQVKGRELYGLLSYTGILKSTPQIVTP